MPEPLMEADAARRRQESEASGIINPSLIRVEQAITSSHVAVTMSEAGNCPRTGGTHAHMYTYTRTHAHTPCCDIL